jgi:predicted house-cleaning noncanonical NTP pyrophosphatase (MazG superfamily)
MIWYKSKIASLFLLLFSGFCFVLEMACFEDLFRVLKSNQCLNDKLKVAHQINSSNFNDKSLLFDWVLSTLYKHKHNQNMECECDGLELLLIDLLKKNPKNIMNLLIKKECKYQETLFFLSKRTFDQEIQFISTNDNYKLISKIVNQMQFTVNKKSFLSLLNLLEKALKDEQLEIVEKLLVNVYFSSENIKEFKLTLKDKNRMNYQFKLYEILENQFKINDFILDIYYRVDFDVEMFHLLFQNRFNRLDKLLKILLKYSPNLLDLNDVYQFVITKVDDDCKMAFDCLNTLILLDFNSFENDIENLLRILLNGNYHDTVDLFISLLESFVKARKLVELLELSLQVEMLIKGVKSVIIHDKVLEKYDLLIHQMIYSQSFQVLNYLKSQLDNYLFKGSKKRKMKMDYLDTIATLLVHTLQNIKIQESKRHEFDAFISELHITISSSLQNFLVPALQIYLVSMQVSNKFLTSAELLQMFNSFSSDHIGGVLLLEIACLHIKQGNSELCEKVWKFNQIPSNYKTLIILNNLQFLCADSEHLERFLCDWVDEILATGIEQFRFIFNDDFYEILPVRRIFLKVVIKRLSKSIKKSHPKLSKMLKLPRFSGDFDTLDCVPEKDCKSFTNFSELMEILPVSYFKKKELENLQFYYYFIDRIAVQNNFSAEFIAKSRNQLVFYCKERSDKLFTLYDANIMIWFIKTCYTIKHPTITKSTAEIQEITIKQILYRYENNSLINGGKLSPKEYLEQLYKYIKKSNVEIPDFHQSFYRCISNMSPKDKLYKSITKLALNLLNSNLDCIDLIIQLTVFLENTDTFNSTYLMPFVKNDNLQAISIIIGKSKTQVGADQLLKWFELIWSKYTGTFY